MNDTKAWYQSKTIWGGLAAILGAAASLAGYHLRPDEATDLVDAVIAVTTAGGGLLAILGRITARKRLE
jgi:hypothetical protein